MNQKVVITIVAVVILLAGGLIYVLSQPKNETETSQPTTTSTSEQSTNSSDTPTAVDASRGTTIVFTNDGFGEGSYKATVGSVVTVKNESDMSVQFSSDDHPTHRENTEMNLQTLAPGESASFTVTKKGTHGFHDHINDQYTGTLVVE